MCYVTNGYAENKQTETYPCFSRIINDIVIYALQSIITEIKSNKITFIQ